MTRQKFSLGRTIEGTAFEIAFVVLAILVWVYVTLSMNAAPDTVPTHFGPSGAPDAYGSKWSMLFPCIMMTVVGGSFLFGAYFPHTLNLPGVAIANMRQALLGARMMRIMALLFLALTAAIAADIMRGNVLFIFVLIGAILLVGIVFTFLIYRSR